LGENVIFEYFKNKPPATKEIPKTATVAFMQKQTACWKNTKPQPMIKGFGYRKVSLAFVLEDLRLLAMVRG